MLLQTQICRLPLTTTLALNSCLWRDQVSGLTVRVIDCFVTIVTPR